MSCRAKARATMAVRSLKSSSAPRATSTRSIRCCSARRKSSSRRSRPGRPSARDMSTRGCSMPRSRDVQVDRSNGPGARIALVVDRLDWHARALTSAFAGLGARALAVALPSCAIDTGVPCALTIPGFGHRLPDAVMVRSMSGGTFEAVTLRLGVLHALRELGVMVWNDARAIERCVDKSMTSFLLARAGIPTPATWATESLDAARAIVRRETSEGPLVLKPLFGSQGRGLKLIRTPED